ncbi:MAG TPA: hypothetical protein VL549_10750 [Gemmatimonadales bacterium]|nr:hypothetical protein [Gemmatimonadales bacterium]
MTAEIGNSGNAQVILLGNDGRVYLSYQVAASGNWYWAGSLPSTVLLKTIASAKGGDGNIQIVGLGKPDGLPYLIYQVNSSGNWHWAGDQPTSNGFAFSSVANGIGAGDDPDWIFTAVPALGATDGLPYAAYQDHDGTWSSYPSNTTSAGAFATIPGSQRLSSIIGLTNESSSNLIDPDRANDFGAYGYLIGLGDDQLPYLMALEQYIGPCSGYCTRWGWRGLLPNGLPFKAIAAGLGDDEGAGTTDRAQIIGIGATDGQPYLIYQAHSGAWYSPGLLPNAPGLRFRFVATGKGNDGNLQVIFLGEDGLPYLSYQVHASGNWYWAGALPNPSGVAFSKVTTLRLFTQTAGWRLYVIGLGAIDTKPYLIYQAQDGSWHWYGVLPTTP